MNRFRYLSPKRCQGGGSPSTSLLQYSAFSAVVALVATAQSAAAGSFTFTTLNYPGASGGTQAVGINNSGQIVGQSLDVSNQYDSAGWLYSGGTFSSPIVYPNAPTYCGMPYGGAASTTNGINNSAVVVGDYSLYCATPRYGFTYSGGSFTQLNVSPGISTTINGINDSGELVGSSYLNGSTTYSGYFDLGGNVTIFSVLGANFTNANGVNNAGDIVGSYSIQNGGIQNGFLDIGGNFTTIDDPLGVGGTIPGGLNNEGEIVGYYADGSGGQHGFIYQSGVFTTLDDPLGVGASSAWGLNDQGDVVGYYVDANGAYNGFLAVPSPEPSATALVLLAICGLTIWRKSFR